MAGKKIKVVGKAYWARVFEANRDMVGWQDAYKECDGAYVMDLIINEDEKNRLAETGTQKKFTEVIYRDGEVVNYESLSRAEKKEIDDSDIFYKIKLVRKHKEKFAQYGGAPKVLHKDGSSWDFEEDGTIGNGSDVEVAIETYNLKSGIVGTRFSRVKVLNLVEYNSNREDDEEEEEEPVKKEVKKFTTTAKTNPKKEMPNDDIPF